MISDVKHLFMYFQLFLCFLGKNVYSGPLPFVNWNFWVLLSFVSFLYISGINLYQKDVLQEKNFPICMFPCFLYNIGTYFMAWASEAGFPSIIPMSSLLDKCIYGSL